ncbi:hypothetical protein O6R08_07785 [Cutibacterium equinum]|uniref:Transposase n=1 Tax=Cutibacterium equinum TaxID=3016342 RepID=A0ABY7QWJ2_9ACTN|nr:hypothetical protein [Cutibacterium equinum]WCC79417.1 hypothetical protein O6R08_07785 [Cutibacterium equinum]
MWVKDVGNGVRTNNATAAAVAGESMAARRARLEAENARLRADKAKVETECDIPRKAAKYFVGETNW